MIMGIYDTFFHKEANDYCSNGGFETRSVLYSCIENGDLAGIEDALNGYMRLLRELVGKDAAYAKQVVLYVFAQLQLVAMRGGIPDMHCHAVQEAYYRAMDLAETAEEVLSLLHEQSAEFARLVAETKKENAYSELTRNCCLYIREHLYDDLSVPVIAEALCFSPGYLSHKFKEETGKPIQQFVRTERIAEAKLLLRANYPSTEIAAMLDFSSQSHFSEIFRRETGMTPTQFRKTIQ